MEDFDKRNAGDLNARFNFSNNHASILSAFINIRESMQRTLKMEDYVLTEYIITGIIAFLLLLYLIYAMLRPERF
jgi:K+-transporting ATPase KdpF subunit